MSETAEQKNKQKSNANTRLLSVIEQLKSDGSDAATIEVLRRTFRIAANSEQGQTMALAKIYKLIERAESEAQANFSSIWETIKPHFAVVRSCFAPTTCTAPWKQRKEVISAEHMTGLRHTVAHLKSKPGIGDVVLDEAELKPLRDAVAQMESLIEIADLPEHTRTVLLAQIAVIKEALEEYAFWGVEPFQTVLSEFVGTMMTDPQVGATLRENKPDRAKLRSSISAVVLALGSIVGLANASYEFGEHYMPQVMERLGLPAPPTATPAATDGKPHLERL